MRPFVLVVMEHASEWPADVNGGGAGCVALKQEPKELPGDLLRRTYDRIRAIERTGGKIERAVLSCNNDGSVSALGGRVPLARALLSTVLHGSTGRLELIARADAPDRVKHSLTALVGALTEALTGTSVSVSARLADVTTPAPSVRFTDRHPRTLADKRSAA